jgi:hypothetical protein
MAPEQTRSGHDPAEGLAELGVDDGIGIATPGFERGGEFAQAEQARSFPAGI